MSREEYPHGGKITVVGDKSWVELNGHFRDLNAAGWWFQPSWKIWKSMARIIPYMKWKVKNDWNHQRDSILNYLYTHCKAYEKAMQGDVPPQYLKNKGSVNSIFFYNVGPPSFKLVYKPHEYYSYTVIRIIVPVGVINQLNAIVNGGPHCSCGSQVKYPEASATGPWPKVYLLFPERGGCTRESRPGMVPQESWLVAWGVQPKGY